LIFRAVQRRIRLVKRSTALSTTEEMTERDLDITAATILMIKRIFNKEQMAVNEKD
jgi:aldehyde:ferredoxin oxidoreductase